MICEGGHKNHKKAGFPSSLKEALEGDQCLRGETQGCAVFCCAVQPRRTTDPDKVSSWAPGKSTSGSSWTRLTCSMKRRQSLKTWGGTTHISGTEVIKVVERLIHAQVPGSRKRKLTWNPDGPVRIVLRFLFGWWDYKLMTAFQIGNQGRQSGRRATADICLYKERESVGRGGAERESSVWPLFSLDLLLSVKYSSGVCLAHLQLWYTEEMLARAVRGSLKKKSAYLMLQWWHG